jgi:phosphatidylglycerophosphate synthase
MDEYGDESREDMTDRARLSRSIYLSVAGFLVFQTVLFLCFARGFHFAAGYVKLFFFTTIVFHLAILAFLLTFRKDFALVDTGTPLVRVNLANEITLARLSTLPTLLILIIASRKYSIQAPLLILVALVFITDFADGWVSRASRQVTFIGRMLDSISDYSLLIVLSTVFYYYQLIPGWFFALAVFRLVFQGLAMAILLVAKRKINTQSTMMGKAAIAATMVLYTVEVLHAFLRWDVAWLWNIFEYAAGVVVFLSIFEKAAMFVRQMKKKAVSETKKLGDL